MLMDKTTEMVAHLIGIFHTSVEEVRMRDVYDKFKASKAEALADDKVEAISVSFKASYRLEGFSPNIQYTPPYQGDDIAGSIMPLHGAAGGYVSGISVKLDVPLAPKFNLPYFLNTAAPNLILEPPGSVVVVTFQTAFLEDNDLLLLGDGTTLFVDPSAFLETLQQYQSVATAIAAPVSAEVILPGESAAEDAIALHTTIGSVQASVVTSVITGVAATVLHGEDATGLHLNGATVEELARLDEVMPAYHSAKSGEESTNDAEASDSGDGTQSAGADGETIEDGTAIDDDTAEDDYAWPDPFDGLDTDEASGDDFYIEAGHTVVAGGNTLVNEVSINSAWLDAPMLAVMGDVINLEVIAQVNVLLDHDSAPSAGLFGSVTMNGATMAFTSTAPEVSAEEGEAADTAEEPADTGLPSNWVVTRIEGDLVSFNQVHQYSFQTDFDRAEVSFSSTNTYIALGDNTVVNLANLSELGYGYDMIFVGGSMISVNWISQMNVLIDNDTVTYSGISPTSVSGDDNLLFNSASINGIGLNSHEAMSDGLADAAQRLDANNDSFNSIVAGAPVFEGLDVLRVLYIEGDLTTVNWIEQTNVLGDSDQVHLAMDNLDAAISADVSVTTGSNAVVNLASITEYGVDSTVAVGGDVYDDALLYQAELIDTDAAPLGVDLEADLSGLASEAVAFLADDMLSPDVGPSEDAIVATTAEDSSSSDVMQTMLA